MIPMSDTLFDLSLLICTRNRASKLAQTLKSVTLLKSPLKWELIVVDNESTDSTADVVTQYARTATHPVEMILQPGRGVSSAKNAGWHRAKAPIVACIDDDCYPQSDFLDRVFEAFGRDPKLGFLGGRILLHDPTERKVTIQESLEPHFFQAGSFITPGLIQGANVSYRRSALDAVGGFDPWFGAGALYSGDELELMARLSAAGWNGAYDPTPLVYHHHGRKTLDDEKRLRRWYDRGRGAYYAKFILNRTTRDVYVKNWLRTRRDNSYRVMAREMVASLEYVARAWAASRERAKAK
jgi:glycosyltransferase involved in cell wall biosynthesis